MSARTRIDADGIRSFRSGNSSIEWKDEETLLPSRGRAGARAGILKSRSGLHFGASSYNDAMQVFRARIFTPLGDPFQRRI